MHIVSHHASEVLIYSTFLSPYRKSSILVSFPEERWLLLKKKFNFVFIQTEEGAVQTLRFGTSLARQSRCGGSEFLQIFPLAKGPDFPVSTSQVNPPSTVGTWARTLLRSLHYGFVHLVVRVLLPCIIPLLLLKSIAVCDSMSSFVPKKEKIGAQVTLAAGVELCVVCSVCAW